jgi:hypothetical protein
MANETFIIYEGPSLYDGAPIVVLVQTGSTTVKLAIWSRHIFCGRY